jgi:hypothetical protein
MSSYKKLYSLLLPLSPSLWFNSPPPLPGVNKYTVYSVEGGGGVRDFSPQTDKNLP